MNIVFSDESNKLTPEMKALMEQAAEAALETEFGAESEAAGIALRDAGMEIGVTVVDDAEIRQLNRDYRGNDRVTDVLSFPQFGSRDELLADLIAVSEAVDSADPGTVLDSADDPDFAEIPDIAEALDFGMAADVTLIGDVVICFEQAERQAEEYGTGLRREMLYLFVHSIMHLLGYDHMEPDEKAVMRAREEEVLSHIGLARGL